ncbi:MAG: hypothetical protein ACR2F6_15735 [Mycobacteriales bacterium]
MSPSRISRILGAAAPLALIAAPLAASSTASAADAWTFQSTLSSINGSGGSGTAWITLHANDSADVNLKWSGLAGTFNGGPYPHAEHIHVGGQGRCPEPSVDTNGDGTISTTEGLKDYGGHMTSLTTKGDTSMSSALAIDRMPGGPSTTYQRTISLDSQTVAAVKGGTAVIVIHGLDPSTLSKKAQGEKSDLDPSLPLAATSPALCGVLSAAQMSAMPNGSVATGGGSTSGTEDRAQLVAGAGAIVLAGAGGAFAYRRRRSAGRA